MKLDPAAVRTGDPSGILEAFLRMPGQLRTGHDLARAAGIGPVDARSVVLCGMGGSAAGGDAAAASFSHRLSVPVTSVRGYRLPPHVGPDDLVVCLSFSGGTEETLACFHSAVERGCSIVAVASGGTLADRAGDAGAGLVTVPADVPAPRSALGYLTGATVGALAASGLVPDPADDLEDAARTLTELAVELGPDRAGGEAADFAAAVGRHVPVVWGSEGLSEPAAVRWKAAFNENAKVPAFASVLPELDHHEVVGWAPERGHGFLIVVLREAGEHEAVALRVEATLEVVEGSGIGWREVRARGGSPLARALSLMLVGDLASTYHAIARGVDPTPITSIDRLKARMAERRPA